MMRYNQVRWHGAPPSRTPPWAAPQGPQGFRRRDPAVIVGPLMTTSVDTLGLGTYLTIATFYLGLA